jgi:hypothetical protein
MPNSLLLLVGLAFNICEGARSVSASFLFFDDLVSMADAWVSLIGAGSIKQVVKM